MNVNTRIWLGGLIVSLAGIVCADAPPGWIDRAFGESTAGSSSYFESGNELTITVTGEGDDVWAKSDTGRYVFTPLAGDCEIMATIPPIPQEELFGQWARQGLMMRGATLINAPNILFCRNKGTAETGTRAEVSVRKTHDSDTVRWNSFNYAPFATNEMARLRLVRQGDTYSAWGSTNAPAYDEWVLFASQTQPFYEAMNVGVFVSRWTQQTGGPSQLTCEFGNVIVRNLVNAATNATDGITAQWIADPAITNGTVIGYTVSRAEGPAWNYTALGETAIGVTTYDDATAALGTAYRYRIHAQVDEGTVTNTVLVGTSMPARRPVVTDNPSPATLKGVYAEYYKPTSPLTLASARVEPNIFDSWNYSGDAVYPPNTSNGLGELNNFKSLFAGNIIVEETGCYGFVQKVDDTFYLTLDGVRLSTQTAWLNGVDIHTAPVWLEAGRSYPIRVEHTEGGGGEYAQLKWFKGTSAIETVPSARFEPFPWPWQHRDVGDSPRFGNATYDSTAYSFTVASGGLGIDPATGRDDAHFVWRSFDAAEFDLIARVAALTGPAQPGMSAGIAIRTAATIDDAAAVSLIIQAAGADGSGRVLGIAHRATTGSAPTTEGFALPEFPADLRLSRRGTNVIAYYRTATSGGWVSVTNIATTFTGTLYAGMTAFSGDRTHTATGVFDTVTFAYPQISAPDVNIANHTATISTSSKSPMQIRQENDALPNAGYYWSDALGGNVSGYTLSRSDRPDEGFTPIASLTSPSFTYSDPIAATNTLVFYKLDTAYDLGALAGGGSNSLHVTSVPRGVSDGSITGTGTGLFAAFHRFQDANYYLTNLPIHTMIRNLNTWEKGGDPGTPMVTAANSDDGAQIGPDRFACTWAGWVVPQYTGYHWFRTQTDDAVALWVNGTRAAYYWGFTSAAQTSMPFWLEAGQRVPIHIYFQQGTGGGYFRMWWKHGYGADGQFITIPTTQLYPLAADDTPLAVAPEGPSTFGAWRNIDINTAKPGHAVMSGTPEAFSCTLTGAGNDLWGSSDGLHFVYQETSENFEIEATFNSLLPSDNWAKVGLMVRDGTAANARNMCVIVSSANGYRIQVRNATGGETASVVPDVPGAATATTPVSFKLVKKRGKIETYVNGVHTPYGGTDIDVSGWSPNLCVGLALTSHNDTRLSFTLATDVSFKIVHKSGSVMMLR